MRLFVGYGVFLEKVYVVISKKGGMTSAILAHNPRSATIRTQISFKNQGKITIPLVF